LFDVGVGGDRRFAAAGLEAEAGLAGRDEVELAFEGERSRREGKKIVEFWLGLGGAPEERVAKTH